MDPVGPWSAYAAASYNRFSGGGAHPAAFNPGRFLSSPQTNYDSVFSPIFHHQKTAYGSPAKNELEREHHLSNSEQHNPLNAANASFFEHQPTNGPRVQAWSSHQGTARIPSPFDIQNNTTNTKMVASTSYEFQPLNQIASQQVQQLPNYKSSKDSQPSKLLPSSAPVSVTSHFSPYSPCGFTSVPVGSQSTSSSVPEQDLSVDFTSQMNNCVPIGSKDYCTEYMPPLQMCSVQSNQESEQPVWNSSSLYTGLNHQSPTMSHCLSNGNHIVSSTSYNNKSGGLEYCAQINNVGQDRTDCAVASLGIGTITPRRSSPNHAHSQHMPSPAYPAYTSPVGTPSSVHCQNVIGNCYSGQSTLQQTPSPSVDVTVSTQVNRAFAPVPISESCKSAAGTNSAGWSCMRTDNMVYNCLSNSANSSIESFNTAGGRQCGVYKDLLLGQEWKGKESAPVTEVKVKKKLGRPRKDATNNSANSSSIQSFNGAGGKQCEVAKVKKKLGRPRKYPVNLSNNCIKPFNNGVGKPGGLYKDLLGEQTWKGKDSAASVTEVKVKKKLGRPRKDASEKSQKPVPVRRNRKTSSVKTDCPVVNVDIPSNQQGSSIPDKQVKSGPCHDLQKATLEGNEDQRVKVIVPDIEDELGFLAGPINSGGSVEMPEKKPETHPGASTGFMASYLKFLQGERHKSLTPAPVKTTRLRAAHQHKAPLYNLKPAATNKNDKNYDAENDPRYFPLPKTPSARSLNSSDDDDEKEQPSETEQPLPKKFPNNFFNIKEVSVSLCKIDQNDIDKATIAIKEVSVSLCKMDAKEIEKATGQTKVERLSETISSSSTTKEASRAAQVEPEKEPKKKLPPTTQNRETENEPIVAATKRNENCGKRLTTEAAEEEKNNVVQPPQKKPNYQRRRTTRRSDAGEPVSVNQPTQPTTEEEENDDGDQQLTPPKLTKREETVVAIVSVPEVKAKKRPVSRPSRKSSLTRSRNTRRHNRNRRARKRRKEEDVTDEEEDSDTDVSFVLSDGGGTDEEQENIIDEEDFYFENVAHFQTDMSVTTTKQPPKRKPPAARRSTRQSAEVNGQLQQQQLSEGSGLGLTCSSKTVPQATNTGDVTPPDRDIPMTSHSRSSGIKRTPASRSRRGKGRRQSVSSLRNGKASSDTTSPVVKETFPPQIPSATAETTSVTAETTSGTAEVSAAAAETLVTAAAATSTTNLNGPASADVAFERVSPKGRKAKNKEQEGKEEKEDNNDEVDAEDECPFNVGDFVAQRSDLIDEYPIIWRVDGKSLLQKFEPYEYNGEMLYKSIPTYSGWRDGVTGSYQVVPVRVRQQTKVRMLVEFLRSELCLTAEERVRVGNEMQEMAAHQDSFEVYIQTLISQALDSNFLTEIIQEKDEYFLVNLKAIDDVTESHRERLLKTLGWENRSIEKAVATWPCLNIIPPQPTRSSTSSSRYQQPASASCCCASCDTVCEVSSTSRVIVYGQPYDAMSLEGRQPDPEVSKDFQVCRSCVSRITLYNKIAHQKYRAFIECARRVNEIQSVKPEKNTTVILNQLLADDTWLSHLFYKARASWAQVSWLESRLKRPNRTQTNKPEDRRQYLSETTDDGPGD